MILSGSNLFENGYHPDLPYRKLVCGVIKQAVLHAQGLELDADGKPTKLREGSLKATAVEYLLSEDFELDCEDLELPCQTDVFIKRVREKITYQDYQIPAFSFKAQVIEEYQSKKVTQKQLAHKYGVTQQRINQIIPKVKHSGITIKDADAINAEYRASNITQKELGIKYGYCHAVISRIVNNNYAHLAGAKY